MKVALAVDGSSCSLRATQFLIEPLKTQGRTEVRVINVQPPVRYTDLLSGSAKRLVKQWNRESGETAAAAAFELLAGANVPRDIHLVTGDPATAIVKLVRKPKCDLIVMGTRGTGTVAGLVFWIRRDQGRPPC